MLSKKKIGMYPFIVSQISVNRPSFQPLVLAIFVAPIFFEPSNLGSLFFNSNEINNPNGIDPIK